VQILHPLEGNLLHAEDGQNLHAGAPQGKTYILASGKKLPAGLGENFAVRPE
jgi:hypothetical protein